jgi:UDP-GlcNAc:undecaprenyl-phosphate GlcNAc-1-phosphate transferase
MLVTPMWMQMTVGLALGLSLSFVMIRWVAPLGWMDRPDLTRKHHARPTPRTGGLALWAGLVLLQISGRPFFGMAWTDWLAVHVMAVIGLMDDRFNLRARYKAVAGLAVAMLLAYQGTQLLGRSVDHVSFLSLELPTHPIYIFPLLMAWFWGVPQAFNLIDGVNGLSMGFGALFLAVLGLNLGIQPALFWGGLFGVVALNFPKAHHFLGDCGALMLGTLFAILGVKAFAVRDPNLLFWVFAYPIVDVCLVVSIRRWKGTPLSGADRSHLHHWMMDHVGNRAWRATPILLCLGGLPMLHAVAIPVGPALSTLGLVSLIFLAFKAFKDRVSTHRRQQPSAQVRREIPFMLPTSLTREASGSHPKL